MLAYLKTLIRQVGDCESLENVIHLMLNQIRRYSPEFGWIYC
jgi:hypothetical protein